MACVCEPCVLDWRGPVTTFGVKIERRTTAGGDEEVRVVADTAWNDEIDEGGNRVAMLRSGWYPVARVRTSEIAEFVEALEARDAIAATPDAPRTL